MVYTSTYNLAIGLLPPLLAQDYTEVSPGFSAAQFIIILIFYVVGAFLCQKIYQKLGVEEAWFAWIPILGTYANFKAGDEENPVLWTILSIIPCINIVAVVKLILAWVKICQKLGKSPWLLLIALIPFGSLALLGYLAYT